MGVSSILVGQVWHTRYFPKRHAFHYPLFMFGLDLSALDRKGDSESDNKNALNGHLWPLSLIMTFKPRKHHLINGEGEGASSHTSLGTRVCNLVAQRTKRKFQPTPETHLVFLVTHLSYYGYCFNPVSFYYVIDPKNNNKTEAIVAEVSNTPWLEMHPYVLHHDSVDQVKVRQPQTTRTNYVFPKRFHVSPFMEMSYNYDWNFEDWTEEKSWCITTAMKRVEDGALQFSATMRVAAQGLNPLVLAWQLARFPMFCMIIQIWIHYQAFLLFVKGITFQPHPTGAETTVSRIIGNMMIPLFALKDILDGKARQVPPNNAGKTKAS